MTRRPSAPVLAVGVGVTALATWGELTTAQPPALAVIALRALAGLSFFAVGALASSRRPQNRVGVLMAAVGLTWFIADLALVPSSLAFTAADMEGGLYLAVVAHLVLAFPSGRLQRVTDRAVVGAVYAWAALGNLVPESLWAQPGPPCDCVHNLLGWRVDTAHHVLAGNVHQVVNAALALVVFAMLVRHWVSATAPGRRALAPVTWASGPILVTVVWLQTVGIVGSLSRVDAVLPYVTPVALMTLPVSLLVGMARSSLARLAIGRLVVELGDTPQPQRLREALASAFHDPSLSIAYWLEEQGCFADVEGRTVTLPPPGSTRAVTILQRDGEPVAALLHDPSLREDPELVEGFAAVALLALDNERLRAAVEEQLAQVRASRARIVAAGDAARRRIERDLHDGAQQRLVNVSLGLRMVRDQLATTSEAQGAVTTLEGTAEQLRLALAELRELAAGIHPAILTEAGLGPALESMAERAPLPVRLRCSCTDRLSPEAEAAAYFVVSEAIANVSKHAQARCATVTVARDNGSVRVEVADDGVGGADPSRGSGLGGLADRVAALDGRLVIVSPPGGGTRLIAEIPCA